MDPRSEAHYKYEMCWSGQKWEISASLSKYHIEEEDSSSNEDE